VTPRVRFENEATQELIESADWYESQRENLGLVFLESIAKTLNTIQRWPDAAPRAREVAIELNVRRAPVAQFPYRIVYISVCETIVVLAIAHESRRPGYWLVRTPDHGR
jgi:hypothetical protein